MTVRPLRSSDIPILRQFAAQSGFEYPEPNDISIEKMLVVADKDDRPIAAAAAKRLIEVFGWFNPDARADLRSEAIAMLDSALTEALKRLGYECAEIFLPPTLERRGFGGFLMKRFGWYRNWTSYGKRLI